MSSQLQGITLQNHPDGIGYRLIELPADLQALLEAEDAPVLTLQSSDTSALLKTPNKTYALRQKNTSNALILLRPHVSDPSTPEQTVAAISTIRETVELDVAHEPAPAPASDVPKSSGSKGKWHERFGRNR